MLRNTSTDPGSGFIQASKGKQHVVDDILYHVRVGSDCCVTRLRCVAVYRIRMFIDCIIQDEPW